MVFDGNPTSGEVFGVPDSGSSIEIVIDKMLHTAADLFGFSGGTGKWVVRPEQLDALIAEWTATRDVIDDRSRRVGQALRLAEAPAPDVMSELQAHAFRESLIALEEQSKAMHLYAESYVDKLVQARTSYLESENRVVTGLNGPHG